MKIKDKKTGRFLSKTSLDDMKEQIIDKYQQLKTISAAAKYFNLRPQTLRHYFLKNNIEYQKKTRYTCNDNFFNHDNELSFYWAGFLAADGNVSRQNDICISLQVSDKQHLIKFKNHIQSTALIKKFKSKAGQIEIKNKIYHIAERYYTTIRFRSHQMARDLKRFNIIPNKTKTYDIPEGIVNHPFFYHFVRGYFDGDGWFTTRNIKGKQRISWGICGNLPVIEKIQNIIGKTCYTKGKPQIVQQNQLTKLTYTNQCDTSNIIHYLYNDATVYLDRKYEIAKLTII